MGGAVLYPGMSAGQGAGPFRWIQILNDTEFGTIADSSIVDIGTLEGGAVIPAGIGLGGNFTGVTLNVGLAIGYKA